MDLKAKAKKLTDEIRVWALPGPRSTKLFNVDGAEQLICTALSDVYYAALTEAVKEATAPPEGAAMGWQPIATAPRDGSTYLIYSRRWGMDMTRLIIQDENLCEPYLFGGGTYPVMHATHWRPLPEPPISKIEQPEG